VYLFPVQRAMSAGQDNGWTLALIFPVGMKFNKSIMDVPSIKGMGVLDNANDARAMARAA